MVFILCSRIGLATYFMIAFFSAQQAAKSTEPRFEVVSIHPVSPNAPPVLREIGFTPVLPGGRYVDSRTSLGSMIAFAYNVEDASNRLLDLPKWARSRGFAIAAKPAQDFPALSAAENVEQVRLMMRAMLEDRFHLQLHAEIRQGQVFNHEVARGGFKFKEVNPPVPPEKEGFVGLALGDDGGRMIGKKSTIAGLINAVLPWLKRPVIDRTGLNGYYDFDVKWSAQESPEGQRPGPGLGTEGIALLLSTLQDQFGLRVTKASGSVKYWVVDHADPLTEN